MASGGYSHARRNARIISIGEIMKIVLTGKMNLTRVQMTDKYKRLLLEVQKQVTKGTDFLVTGDAPGQNKIDAANFKGIRILTLQEFQDMLFEDYPEYSL